MMAHGAKFEKLAEGVMTAKAMKKLGDKYCVGNAVYNHTVGYTLHESLNMSGTNLVSGNRIKKRSNFVGA